LRLCKAIHRVLTCKKSKLKLIQLRTELIDDIKCQLQLAKELQAFNGFAQFQLLTELVVSLSKQAAGTKKQEQKSIIIAAKATVVHLVSAER
jgi:hypothetical protein